MRVVSYLAKSGINGIGCFTAETIQKDELVWQFDPGIDREFKRGDTASLPLVTREFLRVYAWLSSNNTILLCADHGGYFNHEDKANTYMGDGGYKCFASRNISAGEELTTNYAELPNFTEAEIS